jgi:hypothetical protein
MSDTPPAWLRRAGRLDLGGGETVLWSVAEGRRGRRWRSVRRDAAGRLVSGLLLELDPAGRWARLELATAEGMLTLHPTKDGTAADGNVVTAGGMRHLALEWGSDHRLLVAGEPVAAAALRPAMPPGPGAGLLVTPGLEVEWRPDVEVPGAGAERLPGPSWPLEVGEGSTAPEPPG